MKSVSTHRVSRKNVTIPRQKKFDDLRKNKSLFCSRRKFGFYVVLIRPNGEMKRRRMRTINCVDLSAGVEKNFESLGVSAFRGHVNRANLTRRVARLDRKTFGKKRNEEIKDFLRISIENLKANISGKVHCRFLEWR